MIPLLPSSVEVIERGWLSANLILFQGRDEVAAVDSGYVSHAAQTVSLIGSALAGRPLAKLLNTHLHSDHCGGNAALQLAYPQLETFIPPGHAEQVRHWDPVALTYEPTGQNCPRFKFEGLLEPGKEIVLGDLIWEIHAAAGHDPHAVVFFERQSRTLISADALWEHGFGVVFPELEGADAFACVGDTLDLIESLGPRLVIPGHGRVFNYSDEVMARSRSRLTAFVADPVKHAKHAAKVLLKFKLLEVQRQELDSFLAWASRTPYLVAVHQRFFSEKPLSAWLTIMVHELVRSQVAVLEGDLVVNA